MRQGGTCIEHARAKQEPVVDEEVAVAAGIAQVEAEHWLCADRLRRLAVGGLLRLQRREAQALD
jgi:hypothetical protein